MNAIKTLTGETIVSAVIHENGYANVTTETEGTYLGRGEFWSGVKSGDRVRVQTTSYYRPDGAPMSVSVAISSGGPWLSTDLDNLDLS